ncbi:hypothetical protein ONR75_07310 [Rhodopseudomonas sp. P2A-2r]|uniref:hypothetical protein n=1 Tax=Rhodopseudomonas sp. P2A-2r TaxID=2991972 RepID=UPI002234941B|nr:hypothetical protein [Rhodopseudomonas sp. P2A-2r]UZE50490.1 hypothetical protein ONR75_07310 [Rhodopseudomonas sp. P2A-2r]
MREGVTLDLRGVWVNAPLNPADSAKLAYLNGGSVSLKSSRDVLLKTGSTIDVSSGAPSSPMARPKAARVVMSP